MLQAKLSLPGESDKLQSKPKDSNRIASQGYRPAKQSAVKISNPSRHTGLLACCGSLLPMRQFMEKKSLKIYISNSLSKKIRDNSIYERRTQCYGKKGTFSEPLKKKLFKIQIESSN